MAGHAQLKFVMTECSKTQIRLARLSLIPGIIDYFEENELEDAIIFLDFHKVFDMVNYLFLQDVLIKLNFGNSFIKWVKVMCKYVESCVTNNGWTSKPFLIQRGIRRDCPLNALLF